MVFKILAIIAAAIPIILFLRSIFARRPTKLSPRFAELKKQIDLAISIFLCLVGVVVLYTVGKLIWSTF